MTATTMRQGRTLAWSVLVLGCLLVGAGPAAGEVRDHAGFFQPDAVARADRVIIDVKRTYRKDLLIETFQQPPAELQEHGKAKQWFKSGPDRREIAQWAEAHAREEGVDGIYVFILTDPPRIHVHVTPETQQKAFTQRDAGRLEEQLRAGLGKDRDRNATLVATTESVRSTLATNLAAPKDEPSAWRWLLWAALGVAGVWVAVGLYRAVRGARRSTPEGAGGFIPGLLGGLFGAAAGNWLHRVVTGRNPTPTGALTAAENRQEEPVTDEGTL